MRGEHMALLALIGIAAGSPPHARGALGYNLVVVGAVGITPACAGSTRMASPSKIRWWDHPRMRGEHP